MVARLLLNQKLTDEEGALKELVVWKVPVDEKHPEGVRYRLAFVPKGSTRPSVLYDNHHPKGHHKHLEGKESPYVFSGVQRLIQDFEKDINLWGKGREESK